MVTLRDRGPKRNRARRIVTGRLLRRDRPTQSERIVEAPR
jgi:hypothetical protein